MYYSFYGFKNKPFELIPDPNMVFMRQAHREALSVLMYGQMSNKAFLLLTGNVGTGKTTLIRVLLNTIFNSNKVLLIDHPTFSISDFYYYLAFKYGLSEYTGNKAKFLIEFEEFLKNCKSNKERVLLIIDEAHLIPLDLFEEIRLLSNHDHKYNVLSIFLVGQPELNERLTEQKLQALRQRISIRFHLDPFSEKETGGYINFRLIKAGTTRTSLFEQEAIKLIHQAAKGNPRLINILCDHALINGFAEAKRTIDVKIVKESIADLQIPGEENFNPKDPSESFIMKKFNDVNLRWSGKGKN